MEEKAKVNPWVILSIVLFVAAGAPATLFKVPPIMAVLLRDLSLTSAQGGLLVSVFALAGVFLSIPAGMIVSKTGNWRSGLIALASIIIGGVIGAFSNALTPLLVSRIIEGLGMTFIALVGPSVVSQTFKPAQRGRAMGVFMTYMSLGQILMFNVAPLIVTPYGWVGVWWFTALYGFVCLLLWLLVRKQIDSKRIAEAQSDPAQEDAHRGMADILKNKSVCLVTLLFTAFMVSFQGVLAFLPTYLAETRGMEIGAASALTSIVGLVGIVGSIAGGAISDKLHSRKWVMLVGMVLCGVAYFLIPFVPTVIFVVMIVALGSFPNSIPPVAFSGAAEAVKDPCQAGLAIALVTTGQNVGLLLSAPLFGYLLDVSGWGLAFMVSAVISVAGGLVVLLDKNMK